MTTKESCREYYRANRELLKEQSRVYRLSHKEQIRTWLKANRVRLSANHKKYDAVHSDRRKELQNANRVILSQFVDGYLREHPCVDCGESDIRILDFDHVYGEKINAVSKLVLGNYSLQRVQTEIAKCEIRCANCHRLKHFDDDWYKDRSKAHHQTNRDAESDSRRVKLLERKNKTVLARRIKKRQFVNDYLKSHPCVDCEKSDIRVLEFDHVRGEKVNRVSRLVSNDASLEKLRSEILKCEVRCANCHRRKHHGDDHRTPIKNWWATQSVSQSPVATN